MYRKWEIKHCWKMIWISIHEIPKNCKSLEMINKYNKAKGYMIIVYYFPVWHQRAIWNSKGQLKLTRKTVKCFCKKLTQYEMDLCQNVLLIKNHQPRHSRNITKCKQWNILNTIQKSISFQAKQLLNEWNTDKGNLR